MATTEVTLQSSSTDLTRSQRALVSAHWSEITQHLAPPGVAWHWSESNLSHRVKYNWKCDGLIRRAPDGERWETTERLWMYVIERARPDETVGAGAAGQQMLADAPRPRSSQATRTLCDETPRTPSRRETRQVTLFGEEVDDRNLVSDDVAEYIAGRTVLKDPTRPNAKLKAAHHPTQARLSTWCAGRSMSKQWIGPISATIRISTPGDASR